MDLNCFLNSSWTVYSGDRWSIIQGDCIDVMQTMQEGFADVIITSPPFNLGTSSGGGFPKKKTGKWSGGSLASGYGQYNDAMPKEEYKQWQSQFLQEAWKHINDNGALYYNHKPRIQNGLAELPIEWNPGLPLRQIITWKRNGGINFSPSHYLPTYEWIMLFAKKNFRLKNKKVSGIGDVWEITAEKNTDHPAPFPLELPNKILKSIKQTQGIVFDPFSGSATTGVAALQNGFQYIGIELEEKFIKSSITRLKRTEAKLSKDLFL